MNIVLWIIQSVVALYCVAGSAWRMISYEQAAKGVASVQALPPAIWNIIGVFEIVCALGLILPGVLGTKTNWTGIAAVLLTLEMLVVTLHHARFFGLRFEATNPAIWTLGLAIASAFIAYGRIVARPF